MLSLEFLPFFALMVKDMSVSTKMVGRGLVLVFAINSEKMLEAN